MAAAITLQVHTGRISEEFLISKTVCIPCERDARNNAQRRNDVNTMADRYGSLESNSAKKLDYDRNKQNAS